MSDKTIADIHHKALTWINNGQREEAGRLLLDACQNGQGNYDTLLLLARAQGTGTLQSLHTLLRALQIDPGRDEAKTYLSRLLDQDLDINDVNPALQNIVLSCLASRAVNHNHFRKLWRRQFFDDPANLAAATALNASSYDVFKEIFDKQETRQAFSIPLFIEGIKKMTAADIPLETLLTRIRRFYLNRIANGTSLDLSEQKLLAALSIQCFMNEYIFEASAAELTLIAELDNKDTAHWLIYSCYYPIFDHVAPIGDLARDDWPAYLKNWMDIHIAQRAEENRLAQTIPTLGPIDDSTSRAVQKQYEENPYPRWHSDDILPAPPETGLIHKPDVLIAGCGTGRHIFQARMRYPHATITAIDLSRASLAYAMRKANEYHLKDIEFYQADILHIGALKKRFDIIESMGVLHHMDDPQAGLSALTGVLRKNGRLYLGLYSDIARRDIVAARKVIADKKFTPDIQGIRACRDFIKQTGGFESVKQSPDFYTASNCRDLLFHVREIRYTIPDLQKLLAACGLEFQKFMLPAARQDAYRQAFPADETGADLECWHAFEQKNPLFFAAMYQFSCRPIDQNNS